VGHVFEGIFDEFCANLGPESGEHCQNPEQNPDKVWLLYVEPVAEELR